jgi:hypothetical protein
MRKIIVPGRSQVQAAEALESPKRVLGKWPYQWLFPGPNSKQVLANAAVAIPTSTNTVDVVQFVVPDGYRFSLRGIVMSFAGTGWNQGTPGGLAFNLVCDSAGPRDVDFFQNVLAAIGSTAQPYPILGRLEFEPLDALTITVTNNGGVTPGSPNFAIGHIVGHTYPNYEQVG